MKEKEANNFYSFFHLLRRFFYHKFSHFLATGIIIDNNTAADIFSLSLLFSFEQTQTWKIWEKIDVASYRTLHTYKTLEGTRESLISVHYRLFTSEMLIKFFECHRVRSQKRARSSVKRQLLNIRRRWEFVTLFQVGLMREVENLGCEYVSLFTINIPIWVEKL